MEILKDPKVADYAVKLALQDFERDNNVEILLHMLRLVAQAQGSLAELARKASISRQALHQALSPDGNPRLRTFQSVLDGLGLRMSFKTLPRSSRSGTGVKKAASNRTRTTSAARAE